MSVFYGIITTSFLLLIFGASKEKGEPHLITFIWFILFIAIVLTLVYHRASLSVSVIAFTVFLLLVTKLSYIGTFGLILMWSVFLLITIPLCIRPLRRLLISKRIFAIYQSVMPSMSATEREALAAGGIGWEGQLFGGMPNWQDMLAYPVSTLREDELAFLSGPVEKLCSMISDWDITHNRFDLSPDMWQFIKKEGFFGMIIPKEYGGKEFSARMHAEVISKLSGCSITVATIVSVPNSLGPAELLLEYGTKEQKDKYLPRLATGEEIPCFALTGPLAGSDASAMPDTGIVCKDQFEGKEIIGIRLNWDKRYITLSPIATLLGLAFKLYDPDHLLSDKTVRGITCALIPTNTPGVITGRRHFPLNSAFPNGPTQGKDVFIPLDYIIGGADMIGQGWRMLVERLAVGRAISLPSIVTGGSKIAVFATGIYARIRKQFNLSIGRFEGVEEALARIGGNTYIMNATRLFAVNAIDRGESSSIASAISKYHVTELARSVVNDAMDVHGGRGICLGPHNYIGRPYEQTPISITVEGANILTRSMIIFGQGAMRCHPYIFKELQAAQDENKKRGLIAFDKALFAHMGYAISNKVRAFLLAITNGHIARQVPEGVNKYYYQQLTRFSAAFAFAADISMLLLGGDLKRRERLSARLGDVLSMMYQCSAVLKRFYDQGSPAEDLPLVRWSCRTLLWKAQTQLDGLLKNLPNRWVSCLARIIIFPFGKKICAPADKLDHDIAQLLLNPGESVKRLTEYSYLADTPNNPVGYFQEALEKVLAAEELEKRLQQAFKKQKGMMTLAQQVDSAIDAKMMTKEEGDIVLAADVARRRIIAVDDFSFDELRRV